MHCQRYRVWYVILYNSYKIKSDQHKMYAALVPSQFKGFKTGASTHAETTTRHDAILLFEQARRRLLDVNSWQGLCGPATAEFRLTDNMGRLINTAPETGNLIRIKLPAPSNSEGDGYDWVRIEEFESRKDLLKDLDIFGFRVRPVHSPGTAGNDPSHFYKSTATSTFLIIRETTKVSAVEKGRNEVPNHGTRRLISAARNLVIAVGAWMGFSKSQWGRLMKGIIKGPPHD
jgi:hypothetical protein